MKLKNVVIVVGDAEKSAEFYKKAFGLDVILRREGNVMLTEGLVLQERSVWEQEIGKDVISRNHACELYFEENNMEGFVAKLENCGEKIEYVTPPTMLEQGQKVLRFYDLDGNLIEVRTRGTK